MRWDDRVYGQAEIDDPAILALIDCQTFQRLKGIRQSGPSALTFAFKDVTRYEHSLGVHLLLRRLGADRRQQVAGLLHDISHTAFSHAVDFIVTTEEQDHHEHLKPLFLNRPDIKEALSTLGYRPEEFYDDSIYPLLERPLPWLCADRVDYFFRDSRACGVSSPEQVSRMLGDLTVVGGDTIAFATPAIAREAVGLFAEMNKNWWAGPIEAYIYNEFADALRRGFRLGALHKDDLLGDDALILDRLEASGDPAILETLRRIRRIRPEDIAGYVPKVEPKTRWLDPPVRRNGQALPLSGVG